MIIRKRIHVRVEHVHLSRCEEEFMLRKKKNDELKAAAKARGETISTKRQPKGSWSKVSPSCISWYSTSAVQAKRAYAVSMGSKTVESTAAALIDHQTFLHVASVCAFHIRIDEIIQP
ncbi:unnamed protein product [Microthlaspi erraticum]|uniref:60S ribosomal protein L21 n=1 Tax=Microthlaspi erraticum TaxID=1685480 RepID=A0A6D2IJ41_9BRAS|nr:unnamed protein product [Microthlaspi erraticum]